MAVSSLQIPLMAASLVVFAGVATAFWRLLVDRPTATWGSLDGGRPQHDPLAPHTLGRGYAALLALLGGALGLLGSGLPVMALVGAWLGWSLPPRVQRARHRALLRRLDRQLVAVVRDLCESLVAGMNLAEAVGHAADRSPAPMEAELRRAAVGLRMGERIEVVFGAFARRIGTAKARRLAEAISIGLGFGGSLQQTLLNLERQMTDAFDADERRQARTDSARRQGTFVAAAVPVMIVVYLSSMGADVDAYYHGVGGTLVLGLVGLMVLVARKMTDHIVGDGAEERIDG